MYREYYTVNSKYILNLCVSIRFKFVLLNNGNEEAGERERECGRRKLIHTYLIKEKKQQTLTYNILVMFKANYICAIKIFVSFKDFPCILLFQTVHTHICWELLCKSIPLQMRFVAILSAKTNIFGYNCNVLPRILCWFSSHLSLSLSFSLSLAFLLN